MAAKAYNPTPQPVVIDAAGHILAGGDRGEVDTTLTPVIAAVGTGRLVLLDAATQTRVEKAYAEARAGKAEQASADAVVDQGTGAPVVPPTSEDTSASSTSTSNTSSSGTSSSTSPAVSNKGA